MNLPLRSLAVFAAGLLCIETCSAVSAGKASEAGNSMLASQQEAATEASSSQPGETVVIPGPLRPFLRMAGISQEASPAEVLPLLARNVSISGYENDKPTEYLILIDRYVHLARELQATMQHGSFRFLVTSFRRVAVLAVLPSSLPMRSALSLPSIRASPSPRLRRPSRRALPSAMGFPVPLFPSCSLKKRGLHSAWRTKRLVGKTWSTSCCTTGVWTASIRLWPRAIGKQGSS